MKKLILSGVLALASVSIVSATPLGSLTLNGCAGNQVRVSLTAVDWEPVGGGTGCFVTGSGTNITYNGGSVLSGIEGLIVDLPAGPFPVVDFLTFSGNPLLHFDLSSLGPGSANTACAGLPELGTCSALAGSPFVLQRQGGSTVVSLSVTGVARDGTAPNSTWLGTFSATFAGQLPDAIQTTILGGGTITSTYAGSFVLTVGDVPEPSTMALLGFGLAAAGLVRSRSRRA